MIDRITFIKTIQAAKLANREDFVRAAAADWLASWPGDLDAQLMLAEAEMDQALYKSAIDRLKVAMTTNPENVSAYKLLARALEICGDTTRARVYNACAEVLLGNEVDVDQSPSWASHLQEALQALASGDPNTAALQAQEAMTADPNLPLPTLIAVKSYLASGQRPTALSLVRAGHDRWPECVAFRLLLADELLSQGETSRGVAYLHQAASDDPLGSIAESILGADHPYRSLWPSNMMGSLCRPIPADVASVLGDNQLAGGHAKRSRPSVPDISEPVHETEEELGDHGVEVQAIEVNACSSEPIASIHAAPDATSDEAPPEPKPWEAFQGPDPGDNQAHDEFREDEDADILREVEQEFLRLASRINTRRRRQDEDGRVPAYVVLSSHTRFVQTFDDSQFQRLDEAIMSLVEVVRRRPGWTAYRIYVDDPTTVEPFGLSPIDPSNAWQIKLRLADLDQALAQRGEMIGALLIVGGDSILPFHRLPNPTDDDDEVVLSDNPYATTDENYFAPEWPVGRFPVDDDPGMLVNLLRSSADEHRLAIRSISPWLRFQLWLAGRFGRLLRRAPRALGYSASIWRKASLAVFKTIGDPGYLLTSPPTEAEHLPPIVSRRIGLSYFNLHGLEDAPEWFGQRDPQMDEVADPEFPIAYRPQDVINSGNAPNIVFTEACYGANSIDKSIETALCLKFLSSGSHAVLGSTKISYGSVTTPLIAADLLGRLFWELLNQSLPVGEALRRAKLSLAAEMHRRQGFLDGEDQKTLISFVLYGDPLYNPVNVSHRPGHKLIIRRKTRPRHMRTVCALGDADCLEKSLDAAEIERVKSIVAQYLPGMADAQCRIHPQRYFDCDGEGHLCPSHQLDEKRLSAVEKNTLVVTFSKHVKDGDRQHPHYARLTLDPSGKVLKLAVSR
jgi:tetratricopeptide (TPR) repeat protein